MTQQRRPLTELHLLDAHTVILDVTPCLTGVLTEHNEPNIRIRLNCERLVCGTFSSYLCFYTVRTQHRQLPIPFHFHHPCGRPLPSAPDPKKPLSRAQPQSRTNRLGSETRPANSPSYVVVNPLLEAMRFFLCHRIRAISNTFKKPASCKSLI